MIRWSLIVSCAVSFAVVGLFGSTSKAQDALGLFEADQDVAVYSHKRKRRANDLREVPDGQLEIIAAQAAKRGLNYVEVKDVEIVKILPQDNHGSRHQKWIVRLSNGNLMDAVYNVDICDEIPLEVGARVSMGGQYIWDNGGGLLHWLHEDPAKRRPHGYVDLNGKRYGKVTRNDRHR